MILIDTSVLISALKGKSNKQTEKLDDIIEKNIPWGITLFIYQEILQGAKNLEDLSSLKDYFRTQRFYYLTEEKTSYEKAAEIYFKCRKEGYTINSSIDCLVAQTAIENNLLLLHDDSDYDYIKMVIKELKIY